MLRWSEGQLQAHQQRTRGSASPVLECVPLPVAKGIEPSPYAGMNETEKEYAQILEAKKVRGEILWWEYEGYALKIAHNTRYTPDFAVMLPGGEIEFHETKGGYIYEDSWIKLKVAASKKPHRFYLCQKKAKKDGGGWDIKDVRRV